MSITSTAETDLPWADARSSAGTSRAASDRLAELGRPDDPHVGTRFHLHGKTIHDFLKPALATSGGSATLGYLQGVAISDLLGAKWGPGDTDSLYAAKQRFQSLGDLTGVSIIGSMRITGGAVVTNVEAELRAALRHRWPNVVVERSALDVAPHVSVAALRAVVEAARTAAGGLRVARLEGFRSREDPDWYQLLLVVENPGAPGSPAWQGALEAAGAVIEVAIQRHPETADAIASQISFEL